MESIWYECVSPDTWPNWVLVIAGLGAILVGIRTLRVIERQTRAAELAAEGQINANRAWLIVEKLELSELIPLDKQPPDGPKVVYYLCYVKNAGSTPATVFEARTELDVRSKRDASDAALSNTIYVSAEPERMMEPRIVPPGVSFVLEHRYKNGFMSQSEINAINLEGPERSFLFAHGIIKYWDVFRKEKRATRFCYRYDIEYFAGKGRAGFYFTDKPGGYNEHT